MGLKGFNFIEKIIFRLMMPNLKRYRRSYKNEFNNCK